MPLDRQVGMFEAHWEDAYDDLPRILEEYRATIHRMGRERGVDGFAIYGDSAVRMPPPERLRNVLEEFADALWYATQGDLPAPQGRPAVRS